MNQEHNNIKSRKFKQIKFRDRIVIETLRKQGHLASKIAKVLDFSKRSINREIKRGMVYGLRNPDETTRDEYSADAAQRNVNLKAQNKGPELKIGKCITLSNHLENEILKNKKSPYAALQDLSKSEKKFKVSICEKTLYNYIHSGLFIELTSKNLAYKMTKRKKSSKPSIAHNNRKGTSIEERPLEVLTRERYGDWELDTVVSKRSGKGAVLLVLTERKTRKQIVRKIKSKTQESVVMELNKIEKEYGKAKYKEMFKTITVDNGVEFLDQLNMEKSGFKTGQKTKVYYCHAYCFLERGSNENANKLIRRWIPKGEDIGKYSKRKIKEIENWINNYPRKLFNGLTSIDLENICMSA